MKKHVWVTFLIALLLMFGFSDSKQTKQNTKEFIRVLNSIKGDELLSFVKELSSDKYRGRLAGTPEYMKVAEFVAAKLKKWKIKPFGDKGTYFQYFKKSYVDIKELGTVSIQYKNLSGKKIIKKYSFPENYYPGSNSDSGSLTAEVVYVGYGISASHLGYDDYKGIDVKGKILLMDTGLPVNRKDKDFASWVPYSYHQYKQKNAVKHGAKGMLYINNIANPNTDYISGFIYCHVSKEVAKDLFFETGRNYGGIKQYIGKMLKPSSFFMNKTATIKSRGEFVKDGETCNVIGILEGSDPVLKKEVIIVGGHLDGVGYYGDVVLPGAMDNGSGVADIMGAARALAMSPVKLKRSVMFLFIGGEEGGLLGSKFYCDNPKFPKSKTVCYFNIDMAGAGSGVYASGVKSFPHIFSSFYESSRKYLKVPFKATGYRKGPGVGRPRSDGVIFKRAGFRAFGFGTFRVEGEKRTKIYYHHPLDNTNTLQSNAMENLAKLIYVGLTKMANKERLID